MDIRFFFVVIFLISPVCCQFNRIHERSVGKDGGEMKYDNQKPFDDESKQQEKEEQYKIRKPRQNKLARDRYSIQNVETFAPTETPIASESIHFDKEIKEAKAALIVMIGYISLTFIITVTVSCCLLSITVVIVALIWSKRRNPPKQQQQPVIIQQLPPWSLPPPPPQEMYQYGPRRDMYRYESSRDIYQNDSQDITS